MDKLKYVGKRFSPGLVSLAGSPVDYDAYRNFEIKTFRELFRSEVIATVRKTCGMMGSGVYKDLAPQFGAFECLLQELNQKKCELMEITQASHEKEEFLARVQVRIPITVAEAKELFSTANAETSKNFVLTSFYIGICKEFAALSKKNELLDEALKDSVSAGFLGSPSKKQQINGESSESPASEDKAFDPEVVISGIIKDMRLDRRYNYSMGDNKSLGRHFYHSPEGFIFGIEVDGYVASSVPNGE